MKAYNSFCKQLSRRELFGSGESKQLEDYGHLSAGNLFFFFLSLLYIGEISK